MGFDASKVELDSDARQVLRESSHLNSVDRALRQHGNIARGLDSVNRILRSVGGMDQFVRDANSRSRLALSAARLAGSVNFVGANTASLYADLAKLAGPESLRRGLPGLGRNLASMGYYPRLPSDVMRHHRMIANIGPSGAVAQALKLHGVASAYSGSWSLHRVPPIRTPALQSFLKSVPTFGPIVVSPDDEDVLLDYQPDLQEWLIPERATESGDAVDVEELVNAVFAYTLSIAQHRRTRALLTVVGKHGGTFLIRVAENTAAGLLVYWLLSR